MARTYWPHESRALGDWIALGDDHLPDQVVGVVNDVRFWMWHDELAKQIYASQIYTLFSIDASAAYPGLAGAASARTEGGGSRGCGTRGLN